MASAQRSGRSPMSRWPQSAITRSGASSRRAKSRASATASWLSRAPESTCGADRVARQAGPFEKPVDSRAGEDQGIRRAPAAEDRIAEKRAPRDRVGPRSNEPARADDAENSQAVLGPAGSRRDSGGRCEHERPHLVRTPQGKPERDDTAERMAGESGGQHPLALRDQRQAGGVDREGGNRRQRRREPVPG